MKSSRVIPDFTKSRGLAKEFCSLKSVDSSNSINSIHSVKKKWDGLKSGKILKSKNMQVMGVSIQHLAEVIEIMKFKYMRINHKSYVQYIFFVCDNI